MSVSVAVVTRGVSPEVERLAERLVELTSAEPAGEVLVVAEDPDASEPTAPVTANGALWVRVPPGRGLGFNRNRAVEATRGDVLVFVDDDCWPADDWLGELLAPFDDALVDAVMGGVRIPRSTFLGDSIAALGFPAGGSVGFEVMFDVDEDGYTDHLSTLNCALRRSVFSRVGGFDESMAAGGEDGELAHRITAAGLRIRFTPEALVDHAARTELSGFATWFFTRGRAARQFARRAPAGPRASRRLASYGRILSMHRRDRKIVAIVPLMAAAVVLQQAGFVWESVAPSDAGSSRGGRAGA